MIGYLKDVPLIQSAKGSKGRWSGPSSEAGVGWGNSKKELLMSFSMSASLLESLSFEFCICVIELIYIPNTGLSISSIQYKCALHWDNMWNGRLSSPAGMVAHSHNPSTWEADHPQFE